MSYNISVDFGLSETPPPNSNNAISPEAETPSPPTSNYSTLSETLSPPTSNYSTLSETLSPPTSNYSTLSETLSPPTSNYATLSETPSIPTSNYATLSETPSPSTSNYATLETPSNSNYSSLNQEEANIATDESTKNQISQVKNDEKPDPNNKLFNSFLGVNRLPTSQITIVKYLAAGAFGQVYKGSWGNRSVALKKIDFEFSSKNLNIEKWQVIDSLEWEVSRLSTVNHPNLVQFYGIYQHEDQGHTYLIMEFCDGGTLQGILQKNKDLPWSKRWQWAMESTEGLIYLHNQGVLHRDLKSENILLDKNWRAKLADLGVAQVDALLSEKESMTVSVGFQDKRFIAPENVTNERFSSKATDVYALGLVFWEIASGHEPRKLENIDVPSWYRGITIEREPIPIDCPESIKQLILSCWQNKPANRPTAETIVTQLKQMGPEFLENNILIDTCEQLELLVYPKRLEGLSYVVPFVTERLVEGTMEAYWSKREQLDSSMQKELPNPPYTLYETFQEFISNTESSTLLLLGGAGLGKTLTTYLWGDQLLQQWWAHIKDPSSNPTPSYLPIFIRPTLHQWSHKSIKGAYLNVKNHYRIKDIPVLLFVDGYDELQLDEVPTNLVEQLGLTDQKNTKLIVTCRPGTVDETDIFNRFSFNGLLQVRYFLPFSIDQLLGYLQDQLSWSEGTRRTYKETLEQSPSIREVLRNPFVLYLLRQSWKTLVSKKSLEQLSRSQIYEGFVEHAIDTNSSLLSPGLQNILKAEHPNLVSSYQSFANKVAFRAIQNNNFTLSWEDANEHIVSPWVKLAEHGVQEAIKLFTMRQENLNQLNENERAKKKRRILLNEDEFVQMMKGHCQQFEVGLPLKLRKQTYEYTHKSLFEYFLAKQLLELRNNEIRLIQDEELEKLINNLKESHPEVFVFMHEEWQDQGPDVASNYDAILLSGIGVVLYSRAKYDAAIITHSKALAILEKIHGKEHPVTAESFNNIADVLRAQGKYANALEYFQKSLSICEKVYGTEHPKTANSYHKVGSIFRFQGKNKDALTYYFKALEIYEKVFGKEHKDVALSYSSIGVAYDFDGDYDKSLEYSHKGLEIREKILRKDHPDVATSYNNIGKVLALAKCDYTQSLEYLFKAVTIREKVQGKEHPEVAITYNTIGMVMKSQGKHDEAMEYYLKVLSMRLKVLGKEHPYVATSYNNIGSIFEEKKNFEDAMIHYQKGLEIREKVLGKEHPDTATSYNSVGSILNNLGKYEEALEYYNKALAIRVKKLGSEHKDVAIFYNNIGTVLKSQGKYDESMEYYKKTLVIREKAFGKEHKDVASVCVNIGSLLKEQGKFEESLEFFLKALTIRKKVFGDNHKDTLSCENSIKLLEEKIGEVKEPPTETQENEK